MAEDRPLSASRTTTLGVYVDATTAVAAWGDAEGGWQSAAVSCDGTAVGVDAALTSLAMELPRIERATVVLGRPLARTRRVRLPRMAVASAERVLEREWRRHVIPVRAAPHAVSARFVGQGEWLASFAPAELLEAVARAADAFRWSAVHVCTAEDALASLAARGSEGAAGRTSRGGRTPAERDELVVLCDERGARFVVHRHESLPWSARATAAGSDAAAVLDAAEQLTGETRDDAGPPMPVALVASPAVRESGDRLASALGRHGRRARRIVVEVGGPPDAVLAVAGALNPPLLPLFSATGRRVRAATHRRTTAMLLAGTAAALLLAAGVEHWRVRRELGRVREARTALAPALRRAIARRAELESTLDVVDAVAERVRQASTATSTLAEIARALPAGATLSMVSTAGDSVLVEGESARSGDVYTVLRTLPSLEQVRLAAPLRQERTVSSAGETTTEHFAYVARRRGAGGTTTGPRAP